MSATRRTSVVGKKGKQAAPEEPAESPEAVALRAAQQQVSSLQEALRSSTAKLEEREAENSTLQQELKSSKSKTSEMHRSLAKRLMHIAMLERTIEEQKRKEQTLTNELVKHTQMLDQVMNFRDKESAREFNELLQENAELTEKCERWKERAKTGEDAHVALKLMKLVVQVTSLHLVFVGLHLQRAHPIGRLH